MTQDELLQLIHRAALTQRLAATGRLIDQVVYKLYGLTAEEIAIVEGTGLTLPFS